MLGKGGDEADGPVGGVFQRIPADPIILGVGDGGGDAEPEPLTDEFIAGLVVVNAEHGVQRDARVGENGVRLLVKVLRPQDHRQIPQVLRGHADAVAGNIVAWGEADHRRPVQGDKRRRVEVGVEDDGHVDLAAREPLFDLHIVGLPDGNLDAGILLVKPLQYGGQPVADHMVVGGDVDGAFHRVLQPLGLLLQGGAGLQIVLNIGQQSSPVVGQREGTALPEKQRIAQFLLRFFDHVAYSRGGEVEPVSCRSDAAVFGHHGNHAPGVERHGITTLNGCSKIS